MTLLTMNDIPLQGKRVLIREDFNVPIIRGQISDEARIARALQTIRIALKAGAAVIILSHLGRPQEGRVDPALSLAPIAEHLAQLLGMPVTFAKDWLDGVQVAPGEVVLCENVRFNRGEKENNNQLAETIASLCDVFVMDAFGSAHRVHASTYGVANYAPIACAGPLLLDELAAINRCLVKPKRPILAIVGGAKVSTKLVLLEALLEKVDQLIVGGGIANTFLKAKGYDVGSSLYEEKLVVPAAKLLEKASASNKTIILPSDVVVASSLTRDAQAQTVSCAAVPDDQMILDIGDKTRARYREIIMQAGSILWNGPIGVFEYPQFAAGTREIAQAIGDSPGYSIAGGGETLAAIDALNVQGISYISTGGGAFLHVISGKKLPCIAVLDEKKNNNFPLASTVNSLD